MLYKSLVLLLLCVIRAQYVIGVSLIKKLMRYEIVYGSRDIYVIRKIKED